VQPDARAATLFAVGIRARGKSWLIGDVLAHRLSEVDPQGPRLFSGQRDLKLGTYEFDYVAPNAAGGLTLIDFEVSATRDVLGRLLLHPHAVAKVVGRAVPLRSVLIVTHLDWNVVEAVKALRTAHPSIIRLAKEQGDDYELVDPEGPDPVGRGAQVSDRAQGPRQAAERVAFKALLDR